MLVWRAVIVTIIGLHALTTYGVTTVAATSSKTLEVGPLTTGETANENSKRFLRKESAEKNGAANEERDFKETVRLALLKLKIPYWVITGKDSSQVRKSLKITYPYIEHKNWEVSKSFDNVKDKIEKSLYPVGRNMP
ncbi:hypothetical protein F441_20787 [Phytophthora nicotianae CJ01A1]|uniref:RxLR effector protein n=6 Tax=Phytophthora nicotianae TaxID=4792 RepID=W2PJG4_PHYN3|nr:hypothetical protein PPTG_18168 [Phytophthora nicotianae INRA-310]XP_008917181.1 hypothetical protein PPTG_20245 [Phytophthora nicotianae INRA-310]ETI32183.1 hypothetical protein F443_20927 [Phytophthora nicotianae P1569]ETK72561.1 hypothetical protein L915_20344 [Phytophthora nicotianae]ETO60909.1 hypothetical protein F444_20941 [Phytophthora nicotianae P1976]ETP02052.1 hypothetical protein F441_20787 [Phytophthora nicotianae CJ01A1]ETP30214.1 hypothetical protein F442_20724 [Phytophthora